MVKELLSVGISVDCQAKKVNVMFVFIIRNPLSEKRPLTPKASNQTNGAIAFVAMEIVNSSAADPGCTSVIWKSNKNIYEYYQG